MGHEAEDISGFVADAGDVFAGAVWVCGIGGLALGVAVADEDLVVRVEGGEGGVVGEVAAFAVGDWDIEDLAFGGGAGESGIGRFHTDALVFADEVEAFVANEGAGEESALAEDLKAIADAKDGATGSGETFYRLHDRREAGDGSAAEVVAVGESSRNDDGIEAGERGILVPDEVGGGTGKVIESENAVLVAVRAWEADDGEFHYLLIE